MNLVFLNEQKALRPKNSFRIIAALRRESPTPKVQGTKPGVRSRIPRSKFTGLRGGKAVRSNAQEDATSVGYRTISIGTMIFVRFLLAFSVFC